MAAPDIAGLDARALSRLAARRGPLRVALLAALCGLPAMTLAFDASIRSASEPAEAAIRESGLWALRLFLLSLGVEPLLRRAGIRVSRSVTRTLGLATLAYALLHVALYVGFELPGSPAKWLGELTRQPYLIVGLASLFCLLAVSIGARRLARRAEGRRALQRLCEAGGSLALLHFLWATDLGATALVLYSGALIFVLALRWTARRPRERAIEEAVA